METPVKVIGWENVVSEKGTPGIRIYGVRQLMSENGSGEEAVRIYINPEYCKYTPVLGHKIIAVEGRFGIDRIIVVG